MRSASLPCNRVHPLTPQLRDELNELRVWATAARPDNKSGSDRVCEGLARLKGVLDSLDDVLQLPQTQDALSSRAEIIENLLEDFLRFVDVYGIFRGSVLGLKQELSGAQVAIRRKDASKLGLHIKAQKKIANEIGKLVSTVGSISEQPIPCTLATPNHQTCCNDDDSEDLLLVIRDVHRLTSSVSAGLFSGVSGSFGPGRKPIWVGLGLSRRPKKEDDGIDQEFQGVIGQVENLMAGLKKNNKGSSSSSSSDNQDGDQEKRRKNEEMRMEVLKRMQEMEDCVGEMERESERVFRSLISTRVSLLNILTHA